MAGAQTQLYRFPGQGGQPSTYALGDQLGFPAHGFAVLKLGDGYCYVDSTGRIVIPRLGAQPLEEARDFSANGLAAARTGGKFGLLSRTGDWIVAPKFDSVGDYGDGAFVVVSVDEKWGVLDATGREIIPPTHAGVMNFSGEAFGLSDGTAWALADAAGRVLTPFHFEELDTSLPPLATGRQGRVAAREGGRWGFADLTTGRMAVPAKYDEVGRFSEGFAAVSLDAKVGYVDRDGREIVAPTFDGADEFTDGMAAVRVENHWGYIDRTGRLVIPPTYEYPGRFTGGVASVKKPDGEWLHINRTGQQVPEPPAVPEAAAAKGTSTETAILPETVTAPVRCTVRYEHLNLGLDLRWDGTDRATHVRAFVLSTGRNLMWDGRVTKGLAHDGFFLVDGKVVVLDARQGIHFWRWNPDIAAAREARAAAFAKPPAFERSESARQKAVATLKAVHADITKADELEAEFATLRFEFDHSAADATEATFNRLEKARAYADLIKALTTKIDRAITGVPGLNAEQRTLLNAIRTSRAAAVQKLLDLK